MASPKIEHQITQLLSNTLITSEQIRKSTTQVTCFKFECSQIAKQLKQVSDTLRASIRITTTCSQIYDRPICHIINDISRKLHATSTLIQRCLRRGFLRRIVNIITLSDFRKMFALLDSSIADLHWLVSIIDFDEVNVNDNNDNNDKGLVLSLPPIASNDPIFSWVWSCIACIFMGSLSSKLEATKELSLLALDSDRNKKIIVDEGGVLPLLRLLKEGQMSAAIALFNLVNDEFRVRVVVVDCLGVPLIVNVLCDSVVSVQVRVCDLIGRMAEFDVFAREEFGRENVVRVLVSILSFDTFDNDDDYQVDSRRHSFSFQSVVEINKKDLSKHRKPGSYSSGFDVGSSSKGWKNRKEIENASPELKKELKISCSRALWMLAKDSVSNSSSITETKGLLCLAKLVENERGVLQINCLRTIMEITKAADSNADLRRSAFKTNSPAAKSVVDQLLRIINESDDSLLKIAAIRSIGSLSRTFPARETRVISPLVDQLSNEDHEVATEAAIALGKFACPDNFLCQEHSKAIIEFNGVLPLMRLLRFGEMAQVNGLALLCYLAINASNHEVLEQARVLNALEGADRTVPSAQQPYLRELISKAIDHLNFYRIDFHPLKQSSLRIY